MLSRLCRSISRTARRDSDFEGVADNQTRNLNTIQDDNNYTPERITRVIRSYFFIAIESQKRREYKIWGREPVIQDSVRKISPFIKEMEPDTLHLLISNLGMLHVLNPGIWRDIEANFLQTSHQYLPTSQLVPICEAFSTVGRKNNEVWAVLSQKVLNEIYSTGNLETKEFSKIFHAFTYSGIEFPELNPHFQKNFAAVVDSAGAVESFSLLESLSKSSIRDAESVEKIVDRCLSIVESSENKNYMKILVSLVRLSHNEYLDKVEELFKNNMASLYISPLASLIISYIKPELLGNEKRKNFVEFLFNHYKANKDQLARNLKFENAITIYDMKFLLAASKYGIKIDEDELVNIYKSFENMDLNSYSVKNLKTSVEEHLKSKNLI